MQFIFPGTPSCVLSPAAHCSTPRRRRRWAKIPLVKDNYNPFRVISLRRFVHAHNIQQRFFNPSLVFLVLYQNEMGSPGLMFVLAFIPLNFKQTQLSLEQCFGWWTGSLTPGAWQGSLKPSQWAMSLGGEPCCWLTSDLWESLTRPSQEKNQMANTHWHPPLPAMADWSALRERGRCLLS